MKTSHSPKHRRTFALALPALLALGAVFPASSPAVVMELLNNGNGGFNGYSINGPKTFDTHRRDAGLQSVPAAISYDAILGTFDPIPSSSPVAGHLATIRNATENTSVISVGTGDRFIGLTDLTAISSLDGFNYNSLGTSEAGNTSGQPLPAPGTPPVAGQRGFGFAWVTGEPLGFMNWNSGEPNDSSGEDAIHLTGGGAVWNDQNAGSTVGETDHNINGIYEFDLNSSSASVAPGTLGFNYREVKSNITPITSLAAAEALLSGTDVLSSKSGYATVANLLGGGGDGHFGNNDLFMIGGDNFASEFTGQIYIPEAGEWTFGTNSDDGSFLQIGDFTKTDDVLAGPHDHFATFLLEEGFYDLRAVFFEAGGGDEFELFAAQGSFNAFNGNFRLVGDVANGGLMVFTDLVITPEPASLALWAVAGALLFGWARRRKARK